MYGCTHMIVGTVVLGFMCGGQGTACRNLFSLSIMWILEAKLWLPDLVAGAISPALQQILKNLVCHASVILSKQET